jgi:hypothetical protein
MKTQGFRSFGRTGLATLALAFLPAASLATFGQGQGQGHGKGSAGADSAGDDDIGSLPGSVVADMPSIVFVGSLGELQWVILDVQGQGKLSLRPAAPGSDRLVLELDGNFGVKVDLAALAASKVDTYFSAGTTFAGGAAAFYAQGVWSRPAELETYTTLALPLDPGSATLVRAVSPEGQTYGLRAVPQGSLMHISQVQR